MADLTLRQVGDAITGFGHYRTVRTQKVALQGAPDGISGITVMAMGLRETGLRNVNGGAVQDEGGDWVLPSPEHQDDGVFQISRDHHPTDLKLMPGVKAGTWAPVIHQTPDGKFVSAFTPGYCPRFEDSLQFTLKEMHEAQAFAQDHAVHGPPLDILLRFAVAAHNAGKGGALSGYRNGDVDKYTTHADYSAWVLRHARIIREWLRQHPNWHVRP